MGIPLEIVSTPDPGLVEWFGLAIAAVAIPASIFSGFWLNGQQRALAHLDKQVDEAKDMWERIADARNVVGDALGTIAFITGQLTPPSGAAERERFKERWGAWIPARIEGLILAIRGIDPGVIARFRLTESQLTLVARLRWIETQAGDAIAASAETPGLVSLANEAYSGASDAVDMFDLAVRHARAHFDEVKARQEFRRRRHFYRWFS